jgi:IS30 family transposase
MVSATAKKGDSYRMRRLKFFKRRQWTATERAAMWKRWKLGESVAEIARALGRPLVTVHNAIEYDGGIAPRERVRRACHLTLAERETISRALAVGDSLRSIARTLGRPASTVCREVRRNQGRASYRAAAADDRAWQAAERPKSCKMMLRARLLDVVAGKLRLQWSPEQIAGWLKRRYPDKPTMHISHEKIYRSLFMQTRGILKDELQAEIRAHLRRGREIRISKKATASRGHKGPIVDGVSIRERPPEAEDRAVPGHWEGDLLVGNRDSYIATLVERSSRYVMLVKVANKESKTVVRAVAKQIQKLPVELRRSLTWDRGPEMARHKEFKVATDVQVYFCDPHSPWQRGSNENTNSLLRQYFPKGESLESYTQTDLNLVARRLNGRPRKTLAFRTPAEYLSECVALTG